MVDDVAGERLAAALAEQSSAKAALSRAVGTAAEAGANLRLRAAELHVAIWQSTVKRARPPRVLR